MPRNARSAEECRRVPNSGEECGGLGTSAEEWGGVPRCPEEWEGVWRIALGHVIASVPGVSNSGRFAKTSRKPSELVLRPLGCYLEPCSAHGCRRLS